MITSCIHNATDLPWRCIYEASLLGCQTFCHVIEWMNECGYTGLTLYINMCFFLNISINATVTNTYLSTYLIFEDWKIRKPTRVTRKKKFWKMSNFPRWKGFFSCCQWHLSFCHCQFHPKDSCQHLASLRYSPSTFCHQHMSGAFWLVHGTK